MSYNFQKLNRLPALNHDFVEFFCQSRRGRENVTLIHFFHCLQEKIVNIIIYGDFITCNLCIAEKFKRFVSETPYLIHDTTKAPHITGSGVLLVVESLQ